MIQQIMTTQIITITTTGMMMRKKIPLSSLEIEEVFKIEEPIPVQFSEKLVKLLGGK